MSLTEDEFHVQCLQFVRKSLECADGWFLSLKRVHEEKIFRLDTDKFNISDLQDGDKLMLTKDETRKSGKDGKIYNYEFSVLFSESYEVPVMYFNASDQNGAHVPLENILAQTGHEDLSTIVNQVEHPLLFRPFYMVHPCRTRDFMAPHLAANKHPYIISWLSVVATLVGLRLNDQFGHLDKALTSAGQS